MKNKENKTKIVLAITSTFCLGFLKGQSKFLNDNGFDVYLFSPDGDGLVEYEKRENCTVVRIPYKREISIFSDIKCLFITIKHLKRIQPDIINVGTPKSGLIGVLAGRIVGIKNRIFTLRGLRSTAEPEGTTKNIVEFMEKLTHKLASKVISITPSMADYAIKNNILAKDKAVVLAKASSNGIDTLRFNPLNKSNSIVSDLKTEFNIQENDFIVGFVGRVVKSKGIEDIYNAFLNIESKYKNLKILIIGPIEDTSDAIDKNILKEMELNPRIILTGQRKKVEFFYQLMNVFSLPSHNFREGFGNVAMEASASSIPIIVTRESGCQDAVVNNVTGKLINPLKPNELSNAIEFYIENKEQAINHGINGVKFANDFFTNQTIWNAQLEFYKKLLK